MGLLVLICLSILPLSHSLPRCKAWLVQSIPTDMPSLPHVSGVLSTADVFRWLAGNSSKQLDIMAQYWQLKANSSDPRSGDYGYSGADMHRFGANEGLSVYKAIENAADRNVQIRLLQHSGVYPDYTKEPLDIACGRKNVESVTLLLSKWWGSGIVHAKVWISDLRHVYIGSANNDWKSLTQFLLGERSWNLSRRLSRNCKSRQGLLRQPLETLFSQRFSLHKDNTGSTMAD